MNDAYAAGLFDGEGYVRVSKWQKKDSPHIRYQVIAGIGMTYRPIIEKLHRAYGGSINQNRHDLRSPNHRVQYTWHIASQIASEFFEKVAPYLIVKKEEVLLAQKLQANINKYRFKLGCHYAFHPERDEIFAYRADLAAQISALKKKTFPLLT